jgi:hypothetical protein
VPVSDRDSPLITVRSGAPRARRGGSPDTCSDRLLGRRTIASCDWRFAMVAANVAATWAADLQDEHMPPEPYPKWDYFPRNVRPPEWVEPFIAQVRAVEPSISTVEQSTGLDSDHVLRELAPGLRQLGYTVESGKKASDRIRRPVLFGSNGQAAVSYDIDGFHDGYGIVVEVEAGRAASNNATYRDIIRASLILDAQYLALLLPVSYRFNNRDQLASIPAHRRCLDLLSALYASQRLPLPLHGVLLVGY